MSPALLAIIATLALSTAASTPPTALERGAPTQDNPFDAIVEQMRAERQEEIGRTNLMRREDVLENHLANREIALSVGFVGGVLVVVLPLATVFGLWRWRPRSLRWQVIRTALWPAAGLSFMIGGAAASAVGSAIYSRPLMADRHIAWAVTWLVVSLLLGGVGGVIAWSTKVTSEVVPFDPAVGQRPTAVRGIPAEIEGVEPTLTPKLTPAAATDEDLERLVAALTPAARRRLRLLLDAHEGS